MDYLNGKKQDERTRPVNVKSRKNLQVSLIFMAGIALLAGAFLFMVTRGASGSGMFEFHHMAMDTTVTLKFESENRREAEAIKAAVFDEIKRLEKLLSRSHAGSDVDRINRNAGVAPVEVSPETLAVVRSAVEFARLSEGAFDPTVAPLIDAWGFLGQDFRVPAAAEIAAARALVDYTRLEVDFKKGTVFLAEPDMSLDLGGIAKGYIVDRGLAVLSRAGVKNAFLNAGGDIGLLGTRPEGGDWRIAVQNPRDGKQSAYLCLIPLAGGRTVVTSGDYQRAFFEEGERYHHILDPATGQPAGGLASVTVVAPTAMEADALSTAVFVLGPERGMALVEQLPGIEAILVTPELALLVSSGLGDVIEKP